MPPGNGLPATSGRIPELLFFLAAIPHYKKPAAYSDTRMVPPMKTLIVYTSVHHQNTEKVAKVMAEELKADLILVADAKPETLAAGDLVGFASGIYFGKHHKTLLKFVETLPLMTGKRAFVFSTSGDGKIHHAALKEKLVNRGFSIVDEFCCKGWDTVGPLKLFGGINKGRPDENDLAAAREFARGLKNKL
jgi:flavodoxin